MQVRLGPRPAGRQIDLRIAFAAVFAALFVLARVFPFHRNPYICTFKQITGYPCFTCGMTRSWVEQVHGHVVDGIVQSPMGSLLFLMALGYTVWTAVRVVFRLSSLRIRFGPREYTGVWVGILAMLLFNWLYTILTGVA